MNVFKFVRVFESGEEEDLPLEDVLEATRLAREEGGLKLTNTVTGKLTTMESSQVMSVIHQLGRMQKYAGVRIDAIDVSGGTH